VGGPIFAATTPTTVGARRVGYASTTSFTTGGTTSSTTTSAPSSAFGEAALYRACRARIAAHGHRVLAG